MPRLTLELSTAARVTEVTGIIDTGAAVSVLPYHLGVELGADWNEQRELGPLAGGLSGIESRALRVTGRISKIPGAFSVPLVFAWANADAVPVLLGQTNFLMEFNVCFYRSSDYFDIWRVE